MLPPEVLPDEPELEVELELPAPALVAEVETVPVLAPWPALEVPLVPPDAPALEPLPC